MEKVHESYQDDGEHGAGRRLLKYMRENNPMNMSFMVLRWFSGKHIGPKRFNIMESLAGAMKKFLPLFNRVLFERFAAEVKTKSGLMLPEKSVGKVLEATVVAVGPGGRDRNEKVIPPNIKSGGKDSLPEYEGTKITLEDKVQLFALDMCTYNGTIQCNQSSAANISLHISNIEDCKCNWEGHKMGGTIIEEWMEVGEIGPNGPYVIRTVLVVLEQGQGYAMIHSQCVTVNSVKKMESKLKIATP
ncbi:hypothetical protein KUTeg_008844, partial [Tegillarca granosa]